MYEEYVKNPAVTKQRMFYETMEDVLPDMKLIIDDGSGMQKVLPVESFVDSGADGETNSETAAAESEKKSEETK